MNRRILFVDDEATILSVLSRQLSSRFEIVTALGPEAGLASLEENGPFAVVVSDVRMPKMNGVEFLARVKELYPSTVRILLSGAADLYDAAAAVNQGNIFRFLLKPCPGPTLQNALETALEQHRLITAEKEVLENTLRGSVEVMTEILSMVNPEAFGQAQRMRRYVRHICAALQVPESWQYEVAAMLSPIGCVAVPPEIFDKIRVGAALTEEERRVYASRSQVAHDLLAKIPRLESIAGMVQNQSSAAAPRLGAEAADNAEMGSRMLRVAIALDELVMGGAPFAAAIARLKANKSYDQAMVAALETLAEGGSQTEICSVRIAQLRIGMVLHSDVQSRAGVLLLGKGQEITPSVIARLRGFAASPAGVVEPLTVIAPGQPPVEQSGSLNFGARKARG